MAAKSLRDQIEKWQQRFLCSVYHLDDFKTSCLYYTPKYSSFTLAYALRGYKTVLGAHAQSVLMLNPCSDSDLMFSGESVLTVVIKRLEYY